jgi:DNA-binding IclR family transcriptional regulator
MIKVIAKAFRVLEALHQLDGNGVRLSEIAVAVKLPTVTVFPDPANPGISGLYQL